MSVLYGIFIENVRIALVALYILFAYLHPMLPHILVSSLFPLLTISFENRPAPFPGRMS